MRILLSICLMFLSISFSFSQNECHVTFIANEGFLLESDQGKILVDGIMKDMHESWCDTLSSDTRQNIINGIYPFDSIDIIAVTHYHRDHFESKSVINYLRKFPDCKLICPKQVLEKMKADSLFNEIESQIIAHTPKKFSDTTITVNDIQIQILQIEHSHYYIKDALTGRRINRHKGVENNAYVFNLGGYKIMHSGDGNPASVEEFETYKLQNENIDLAILDRLFYASGDSAQTLVRDLISPDKIILCHISPGNKGIFSEIFSSDQDIIIPVTELEEIHLTKE